MERKNRGLLERNLRRTLGLPNACASLDLAAHWFRNYDHLCFERASGVGAAPQPARGTGPPLWVNLVPLLLIVVVFYFALIRPQQKKAKDHDQLLKTLKRGDKVVTSGGIVGVVVGVKERSVTLRSEDTKLEVLKSSVSEIIERTSGNES